MLFHFVKKRTSFPDKRGDAFHFEMFHGDARRAGCAVPRLEYDLTDRVKVPLSLSRNVYRFPHIFQPMSCMVVSEVAKKLLSGLPGLEFLKVGYERLFYYPWFEFDFSYYDTVGDYREYIKLIENLPHDEKYVPVMPNFYEMITERSLWKDNQTDGDKVSVSFALDGGGAKQLDIDMEKVVQNPITWASGHVLRSDAFDHVAHLVDWGFFHHGTADV